MTCKRKKKRLGGEGDSMVIEEAHITYIAYVCIFMLDPTSFFWSQRFALLSSFRFGCDTKLI